MLTIDKVLWHQELHSQKHGFRPIRKDGITCARMVLSLSHLREGGCGLEGVDPQKCAAVVRRGGGMTATAFSFGHKSSATTKS